MTRVGIVGSRKYTNSRKVKDFIFMLKNEFGPELIIVSGGQPKGADGYAKEHSLYFGVKYEEYPPYHYQWNIYCPNHPGRYGKEYNPQYFFNRNVEIVENSQFIVCFIPVGMNISNSKGTNHTYTEALKRNKKVVIIS